MNVLFITPYREERDSTGSAVGDYSRSLAHALSAQHSVTVCGDSRAGAAKESNNEGVAIIRVKLSGCIGYYNALRVARRVRPDVVHVQHELLLYGGPASMGMFPLFIALLRSIAPTVITLHHVIAKKQINKTFKEIYRVRAPAYLIRLGLWYLYCCVGKIANGIIVHHEKFAAMLIDEYGAPADRISVIPHGEAALPASKKNKTELRKTFGIPMATQYIFGYFGFIDSRKDIAFLITEFAAFAEHHPESILIIGGSEHPRFTDDQNYRESLQRLKKLAAQHSKNVIWKGRIATENVGEFMETIDCMILPYKASIGVSSVLANMDGMGKSCIVSAPLSPFVSEKDMTFDLRAGELKRCLERYVESDPIAKKPKTLNSWEHASEKTSALYAKIAP